MLLVDVNVLVYAFRRDAVDHQRYARWLQEVIKSGDAFGMSDIVLSGFVQIVTHPAVFAPPSTTERAISFADQIKSLSHCVMIASGPRHWSIFTALCRKTNASGDLVPDAYLAALAIESGCEWITTDRGFARFPGLHWRHPLA